MYCNFPAPTPRLLDRKARIVQPTLVKEFSRAVGASTPRQHGNCINGEAKVILASPQGILRHQLPRKQFAFSGGPYLLFQLSFHGASSTPFNHTITIHLYSPSKWPFTRGIPHGETRLVRTSAASGRFWCSETGTRREPRVPQRCGLLSDSDKLSILSAPKAALADTKTDTKTVK